MKHRANNLARQTSRRWSRRIEWSCWALAIVLAAPQLAAVSGRALLADATTGDWSESRLAMYERLSAGVVPVPIGQLRLNGSQQQIPVFSGTAETSLTLGAGHLPETGALNGGGNAAIAGHRDGFFRSLRDVAVGDLLEIETPAETTSYRITDLWIVNPEDVWVLEDTPQSSVTLITCHPFYFAGNAPNRYVVRAVATNEKAAAPSSNRSLARSDQTPNQGDDHDPHQD